MDKLMQAFAQRAQVHLQTRWAGSVTIAGKTYQGAVAHDTVDVEASRDRWVTKRRLTVSISKEVMPETPQIGTRVTESGIPSIAYKVSSYIEAESFAGNRGFTCIEADR